MQGQKLSGLALLGLVVSEIKSRIPAQGEGMSRAEAFDKAWRLGFKGDFSLYDEIYHPEFKGILEEVELNIEAFKEGLYTLKDFIIFTPPKTLIEDDTFLKLYRYNKLKEADVFTSVTISLKYKEGKIIHQAYAFEELD